MAWKLTKEVMFHEDNAPAHKSVAAMAAVPCVTVAMNWLITLHAYIFSWFGTISLLYMLPNMNKIIVLVKQEVESVF